MGKKDVPTPCCSPCVAYVCISSHDLSQYTSNNDMTDTAFHSWCRYWRCPKMFPECYRFKLVSYSGCNIICDFLPEFIWHNTSDLVFMRLCYSCAAYPHGQTHNTTLCLVDRASFINTLFLFQLDALLFFLFTFTIFSTCFRPAGPSSGESNYTCSLWHLSLIRCYLVRGRWC